MQSKNTTLKICLVTFCLLRSSYALGLPEFDGATFFMEKWANIIDGQAYKISSLGAVKSDNGVMRQFKNKRGYLRVGLWVRSLGKNKTFLSHRLVANCFIPNPSNLPQVNHKNGIKTDNRVENLEWCDGLHNIRHAFKLGLFPDRRGELNSRSKLTSNIISSIRNSIESSALLARKFGVSKSMICRIRKGKSWKHLL